MSRLITAMLWLLSAFAPLALLLGADSGQKTSACAPTTIVDINRASAEDFAKLPGIGPTLARQIVDYRTKHGPFHRAEDLLIIKGIGSKKWKALRPLICVGCSPGK